MALDQHRLLKKLAIKDYINKSETLPRAMKGEIARLNKILDGLQRQWHWLTQIDWHDGILT